MSSRVKYDRPKLKLPTLKDIFGINREDPLDKIRLELPQQVLAAVDGDSNTTVPSQFPAPNHFEYTPSSAADRIHSVTLRKATASPQNDDHASLPSMLEATRLRRMDSAVSINTSSYAHSSATSSGTFWTASERPSLSSATSSDIIQNTEPGYVLSVAGTAKAPTRLYSPRYTPSVGTSLCLPVTHQAPLSAPLPSPIPPQSGLPSPPINYASQSVDPSIRTYTYDLPPSIPRRPSAGGRSRRSSLVRHRPYSNDHSDFDPHALSHSLASSSADPIIRRKNSNEAEETILAGAANAKYQCPHCPKSFSRPSALLTHSYCHTGEQPFACDQCGRKFNVQSNLKRHLRTHATATPEGAGKTPQPNDTSRQALPSNSQETNIAAAEAILNLSSSVRPSDGLSRSSSSTSASNTSSYHDAVPMDEDQ